jgi:predicted AAA+ superfamily ATPase
MYYRRYIEPEITDKESERKVKLLLGPRQSGKTTLLNHCLASRTHVVALNLQDRRQRIKYERDAAAFLQELESLSPGTTVLIDEIQKVPSILDDIQFFVDKSTNRFDFFLTGSSARQMKKQSANLIPGRTHLFHMAPVLQAEQRESRILPLAMPEGSPFPLRPLEEILIYGNLPGLYSESVASWTKTIVAYTELYVEREIRSENIVNDMGAFLMFLKLAALESGQTVNYSKLAGAIGVSVNTVKNYYQVLEDTYVGLRIPAFGRSRKKVMTAPRFLIFDLGMRNALAELPMNRSLLQLDAGHLFEQFVMIELFYRCQYHGRGYKLSTWKTPTGAEVDAIVETPTEAIPVEVKWTDSPRNADFRHLETFLALHPDLATHGYLVCRVDRPRKLAERITALPWNQF